MSVSLQYQAQRIVSTGYYDMIDEYRQQHIDELVAQRFVPGSQSVTMPCFWGCSKDVIAFWMYFQLINKVPRVRYNSINDDYKQFKFLESLLGKPTFCPYSVTYLVNDFIDNAHNQGYYMTFRLSQSDPGSFAFSFSVGGTIKVTKRKCSSVAEINKAMESIHEKVYNSPLPEKFKIADI